MRFVVVSGQSGAGKTTARFALEDLGYFSVDNLPPALWTSLLDTLEKAEVEKACVVVDIRSGKLLEGVEEIIGKLRPFVVFLEARPDVLLKRYNLSRRVHPLGTGHLLREIETERQALAPLRSLSDLVVDTSDKSPREIKEILEKTLGEEEGFVLRLLSFGFKHGPPQDADLVLDARAFPNPFYDAALKPRPGTDPEVAKYVFAKPENEPFYRALLTTAGLAAEGAKREGRAAYTVAVGCTGGLHRSVAVAERLAEELAGRFRVETLHRDVDKES